MARPSMMSYYFSFRFAVRALRTGAWLPAKSVFSDPFTGMFWIGVGHLVDRLPLGRQLQDETGIEVWMIDRAMRSARQLTVRFEKLVWHPIDLDASSSEVALEWILLDGVRFEGPNDVDRRDWPEEILRCFDPRRSFPLEVRREEPVKEEPTEPAEPAEPTQEESVEKGDQNE